MVACQQGLLLGGALARDNLVGGGGGGGGEGGGGGVYSYIHVHIP
jgi:hypothetical protein